MAKQEKANEYAYHFRYFCKPSWLSRSVSFYYFKPWTILYPVELAYIDVWPVGYTDLYLGDLLQLWFSERWLVNSPCQLLSTQSTSTLKKTVQREHDLYLYQLSGSALSGNNRSKVWSAAEGKSLDISLDSAFKYYCIYKGVERPVASKLQTLKTFKTAIWSVMLK